MDEQTQKLVQDEVKRLGFKYVWQVDVLLLKLAEKAYEAGRAQGKAEMQAETQAWLSQALEEGNGVYKP